MRPKYAIATSKVPQSIFTRSKMLAKKSFKNERKRLRRKLRLQPVTVQM